MSYGRQLAKKITAWVDEGLVSPYQAESIRAFETKHHRVGRKSIRRFGWQFLAFFLVVLGGVTLVSANWASWALPIRLGILFVGFVVCQWLAWRLIQEKLPAWLHARFSAWGMSSSLYGDMAAGLLCVMAPVGMLLMSQQYPFSPPLWVSLSWLVWVLLPLMVLLRRDVGMLLVGVMSLVGSIIAPSDKLLFLLFPYWIFGMLRLGAHREGPMAMALYLVWMGCLATVLWPLVHMFWYWPILGLMFYFAPVLGAGTSRVLLQGCGLGISLGWAVLAMWWGTPISALSMGVLGLMVLLGLWQHRLSLALGDNSETLLVRAKLLFSRVVTQPFLLVFLFLFWTLCLAGLRNLGPHFHVFWTFLHGVLALGVAVVLAWSTNRMLRSLGVGMLVAVVGILLVQPVFPAWMRGTLMVSAGFGLWVFLRIRREGGFVAVPLSESAQHTVFSEAFGVFSQKWGVKLARFKSPSSVFFKRGVLILLGLQFLILSKPVWIYEWVRLSGESYVMNADFQDVYSPFRGSYLYLKMTDFEKPWPVVLPLGTRHAYLKMTAPSGVLNPLSLHDKAPDGLYLRIPVKWKSSKETVTQAPFERLFFPESKQASFKKSVGRGSVIWLHVKVRHGYAVLERMTVGEKK